ncbi:TonB family protein [Dysgonomonas hofstadii]|uniref:TonB family protein n=1 Tax=Dysgonomonas hofstadii TaxID=637886 RepID=A0A840CIJ6_9BACT|nr:energy transducer TonB [Dysgonomonas hofstadii]MBB4034489.1 TonB family protein [Dysgonomonas hofstadii]
MASNRGLDGGDTIYVSTDNDRLKQSLDPDAVFIKVDKKPEFEGGHEKMSKYIEKNLRYPDVNADSLISKTVYLKFVVTERGDIKDITVLKGLTPAYDAEAVRFVSSFPKMTPGMKDGKVVTTHFYYELRFMKIDLPEQYADKMPRFVGGEGALVAYIRQNLKYPKEAEERKIEGRVLVRFVVSKTGKIGDIQVLKGVGYHPLDAEAYRIVKDMPDWEPGLFEGKPASVYFTLPIVYRLRKLGK